MKETVDYMVRLFKDTKCSLCGCTIPRGETFLERIGFDIKVLTGIEFPQERIKICFLGDHKDFILERELVECQRK